MLKRIIVSMPIIIALQSLLVVSANALEKLDGPKYTAFGAERAGNAADTIPAATGSMDGVPKGLVYKKSGDDYPDPYANEKPLFTITAANMAQHADKLSEGLKALLQKYPQTFRIPVYPTHRDAKIGKFYAERTAWNYANGTRLVNGIDGLQNYTGGVPFPMAKNAAEVVWNARLAHFHPTEMGIFDDMAVYINGKTEIRRQEYVSEFTFSNPENFLGDIDEQISDNAAYVHVEVLEPERAKGQIVIVHEALDQVRGERQAWAYMPGSRRVRRAPTVGFDTPDGPGGLVTVDDSLGFNGAMVKYDWKLLGKKEMYIPYHSYKFDLEKSYDKLLVPGHPNPDFMRYELHRVWVVEANLKSGMRHVYSKRRLYVDEDSWLFVLTESYDARGGLWRVGILNSIYDYLLKVYITRAHFFHDLPSSAYLGQRLTNVKGQVNLMAEPRGAEYYSPANLRSDGKR